MIGERAQNWAQEWNVVMINIKWEGVALLGHKM